MCYNRIALGNSPEKLTRNITMKKKVFAALSALLTATTLLSACSTVSQKLQFSPNWTLRPLGNDGVITQAEVLTYEVSFEDGTSLNEEYFSVTYCPNGKGSYVTTLSANPEVDGYTYTTALTIEVEFELPDGTSELYTDSVTTTTVFKSTANSLMPVRSEKTVQSHTPRNVSATELKDAYTFYDYTVLTEYNADGTSGAVTFTDRGKTLIAAEQYPAEKKNTFEINREKYSYLDNEQILFAVRGLSSTVLSSQRKVIAYDASTNKVQEINLKPDAADSEKFAFSINGTPLAADTVIEYIPLSISINAKNAGSPVKAWYAKTTDPSNNVYRNVMLMMQTDISYGIGSLRYDLKSSQFAD